MATDQSQQKELLKKLLAFYKRKHGSNYESKFYEAVLDLISTGDVEKTVYYDFCMDNDIEPGTKGKSSKTITPSKDVDEERVRSIVRNMNLGGGNSNEDPCGGGYRGYRTSSC